MMDSFYQSLSSRFIALVEHISDQKCYSWVNHLFNMNRGLHLNPTDYLEVHLCEEIIHFSLPRTTFHIGSRCSVLELLFTTSHWKDKRCPKF